MKVVISKEKGKVQIEEVPIPEIKEGELLVKMRSCGICGSDIEKVFGDYGLGSKKIGHEISGEVANSKNKLFSVGDRVFVRQRVPCYNCHYCVRGDYTVCDLFQKTGVEPCGLAEYFVTSEIHVDNGGVIKIPENLSFEESGIAEPLSCCIRALDKCNIHKGDSAVIIGAGPAGIMHALVLKSRGVEKIFLVDINQSRLNFAKKFGNTIDSSKESFEDVIKKETGIGADLVIIAVSNTKVFDDALKIVRRGGKILLFGVPPKNSAINLDANKIFSNEITILASGYSVKKEVLEALGLISSGKIDVKQLITHRFPIEKIQEAFDLAHKADDAMKIVIIC